MNENDSLLRIVSITNKRENEMTSNNNSNNNDHVTTSNIDSDIQHILLQREQMLLRVTQSRVGPGSSMTTPSSLYITNMRVIYRIPKWAGLKADIIDVNYQDIADVSLKRGILHTDIVLKSRFHTEDIIIPGIDKHTAEQADALIRQGIRGENFEPMDPQPYTQQLKKNLNYRHNTQSEEDQAMQENQDPLDKLAKLADLKQKGAITEEEFQRLKTEILKNYR
jgi:hypothetical protein